LELADRILALLDHLVDNAGDGCIVERDAIIDFALLDRREQQANRAETLGLFRAHGGFHIVADLVLEAHLSPGAITRVEVRPACPRRVVKAKARLGTHPQAGLSTGFETGGEKRRRDAGQSGEESSD
jgi:hypothetical protein